MTVTTFTFFYDPCKHSFKIPLALCGKHIKNNQLLIGYAVLKNQKQIVV